MVTDDVKEEFNIFQAILQLRGTVVLVLLYTENNDTVESDLLIYFKSTILERAGSQKSLPFGKTE